MQEGGEAVRKALGRGAAVARATKGQGWVVTIPKWLENGNRILAKLVLFLVIIDMINFT